MESLSFFLYSTNLPPFETKNSSSKKELVVFFRSFRMVSVLHTGRKYTKKFSTCQGILLNSCVFYDILACFLTFVQNFSSKSVYFSTFFLSSGAIFAFAVNDGLAIIHLFPSQYFPKCYQQWDLNNFRSGKFLDTIILNIHISFQMTNILLTWSIKSFII